MRRLLIRISQISYRNLAIYDLVSIVLFLVIGFALLPINSTLDNSQDDQSSARPIASLSETIKHSMTGVDPSPEPTAEPTPEPTPLPTPLPTPTPVPVSIEIPSIALSANVVEIGYHKVEDEVTGETYDEMDVPEDAESVGWYKYRASPGDVGAAVLNGHFDTPTGAPAIFYRLGSVKEGETFTITNDLRQRLTYRVTTVESISLDTFPKEIIYGERDISQVSLITCAGVWNPATKLYSERLAVIGELESVEQQDAMADVFPAEPEDVGEVYLSEPFRLDELPSLQVNVPDISLIQEGSRVNVYLDTGGKKVAAVDVALLGIPNSVGNNQISYSSLFKTHLDYIDAQGIFHLALYSSPFWKQIEPVQTQNTRIRVASLVLPDSSITPVIEFAISSMHEWQKDTTMHDLNNILPPSTYIAK